MDNKIQKAKTKPTSVEIASSWLKKSLEVRKTEDCFNLPIIGQLVRINEPALRWVIGESLGRLNLFFPENQRMSPQQNDILIDYLLTNYYNITLGDMQLIIKSIISSKVFGSLSPNVIIQEIEKYFSDRLEIAESVSLQKHYEVKSNNTFDDKLMKLWYAKVKENGIPPSRKEEIEKEELEFQKFKAEYERNKINNASSV